jgi:hypothetical protein
LKCADSPVVTITHLRRMFTQMHEPRTGGQFPGDGLVLTREALRMPQMVAKFPNDHSPGAKMWWRFVTRVVANGLHVHSSRELSALLAAPASLR